MSSEAPGAPSVDIRRLIAPRSIALIGAGAWTDAVAAGNVTVGFTGTVWRVHPTRTSTASTPYYRSVADLPGTPDAAFIAVPNQEVPGVAAALAARGAGGFVCFSAGFSETGREQGLLLTRELEDSAGALPYFGPNCYGFVNFFDRVAMMPDQIVGTAITCGVALICQSGTIALSLMFSRRSVPIGCVFTVGNQTRLAVEELIEVLCDDPRVTSFGLYLEGIRDPARFSRAADRARRAGKPIALIKSGRTAAAARTVHSHTGALSGADSVFDAFCRQAGIARCDTLATLCETLKLFHAGGALPGRKVLVMGASGGDMAMTADVARGLDLDFSPLPGSSTQTLQRLLTGRVTVANPFDIHTYLWFDPPALRQVFAEVLRAGFDAVGFMLDCPPDLEADTASYDAVIDVFIDAAQGAATCAALISSLPDTMSERVRRRCQEGGVVPLQGQREALEALALSAAAGATWRNGEACVRLQKGRDRRQWPPSAAFTLTESEGKSALAAFGVPVPSGRIVSVAQAAEAACDIGFPVVMKAVGAHLEHKSEVGGVELNVCDPAAAAAAASRLSLLSASVLVEEMVQDGIAEILVGVIVDVHFGQVLVIGAGGIFTEVLRDSISLLPPWTPRDIEIALGRLSVAPLLAGYRGKPAGDLAAAVEAVINVGRYATSAMDRLIEIDVNPLIVRPVGKGCVAVDTLIRLQPHTTTGSSHD